MLDSQRFLIDMHYTIDRASVEASRAGLVTTRTRSARYLARHQNLALVSLALSSDWTVERSAYRAYCTQELSTVTDQHGLSSVLIRGAFPADDADPTNLASRVKVSPSFHPRSRLGREAYRLVRRDFGGFGPLGKPTSVCTLLLHGASGSALSIMRITRIPFR